MEKILLIDDEEGIRKVLKIILTQAGYSVICAKNGQEGLELFDKEHPAIVITDIKMPKIDGLDVLRAVKEKKEEVEVIVITGHGEMDLAIEALKLQASDFINKPISNDAILIAVQRALDRMAVRSKLKEYTQNLEKKVEEATRDLKKVHAFQTNLIQGSIDGIVGTDRTGEIKVFNRSAQWLSGYSDKEIIGNKILFDLFPPETAGKIKTLFSEKGLSANIDPILHMKTALRSKQKKDVPIRLSGNLLQEEEQIMGSVWFLQDLREIKLLEEKLIQNERLAAVGETVAGMAHAVKNILGCLKGGTFVVEKGLELTREDLVKQGWGMVRRNVDRIQELVMDLLLYAKKREPELERCDPNEIVLEVFEMMESRAKEYGVELSFKRGDFSSSPLLDSKWLHRCLTNLITNAIDACSEPFRLEIPGKVTVTTREGPSGEICFKVSDNGCGMEEEVLRKIFHSFFSTKGSRGTGLGLILTQKMIREHGGRIEVDSVAGSGSTFRIILPKPGEASESSPEEPVR